MESTDFLVIGGGVIGLQIALQWKRRHPDQSVMVLEKEKICGEHSSGRNSGVLHAGFYYSADSLKARFSRDGNKALTAYCEEHDLPIRKTGKLVVTRDESEHASLDELLRRAEVNGVQLEAIDEAQAKEIEPRAKTAGRAAWSPTTSTVDPGRVMARMAQEAADLGIVVRTDTIYQGREGREGETVKTSRGPITAGYLVNAAGLQADQVARQFGFSEKFRILPFKGLYLYSSGPAGELRTNIYPVPNLANPFLGVHFTVTVDGKAKIGPTATPAFWRENYGGMGGFKMGEFFEVVSTEASLMVSAGFDFRGLAWQEIRKYHRPTLIDDAGGLLEGVRLEDYTHWGRPGIRAQLLDLEKRKLVMDFLVEGDARSFHVLNAISPAFTCSIPFAGHCCDEIEGLRS